MGCHSSTMQLCMSQWNTSSANLLKTLLGCVDKKAWNSYLKKPIVFLLKRMEYFVAFPYSKHTVQCTNCMLCQSQKYVINPHQVLYRYIVYFIKFIWYYVFTAALLGRFTVAHVSQLHTIRLSGSIPATHTVIGNSGSVLSPCYWGKRKVYWDTADNPGF